jgi:hypothetical protein
MRRISLLICLLGMSCASWAQTDKASWSNLSTLQAGQKIQVVDMNSKQHSGTFLNVSDIAIRYHDAAGDQSIPKQDVRRVKLMENKHRSRNVLVGLGVGAGAGAGIGAASWEDRGFLGGRGVGALVGLAIGVLAGGVVGALLPSHSTIYSLNSH